MSTPAPTKRATTVKVTVTPREVTTSTKPRVKTAVSAIGAKPTGMVKVRVDGRLVRKVSLNAAGRARTVLHRFRLGKHKVVVVYPGSATTKPSRATTTFKVTKH